MRAHALSLLSLLVALGACTSPPVPDVSGNWEDDTAAFTTCGETFPVAVGLDLSQAGSDLQGTFTLQENPAAFTGEMEPNRITGTVLGVDGSLAARLAFRQNQLTGTFTAEEETVCEIGGTSTTVYEVTLVRR